MVTPDGQIQNGYLGAGSGGSAERMGADDACRLGIRHRCNRHVTAVTTVCFCFLCGGARPSDRPGGDVLNEKSISLRPGAHMSGCLHNVYVY